MDYNVEYPSLVGKEDTIDNVTEIVQIETTEPEEVEIIDKILQKTLLWKIMVKRKSYVNTVRTEHTEGKYRRFVQT